MDKAKKKSKAPIIILCLILAVGIVCATFFGFRPYYYENRYMAPLPANLSVASPKGNEPIIGDFYVSPDGNNNSAGSPDHPFATLEKAREEAHKIDREFRNHIVIALMAGTYSLKDFELGKKDSGSESCRIIYAAYGDGEVIIDGSDAKDAAIKIESAEHIALSGLTFTSCDTQALKISGKYIDITDCKFTDCDGKGIVANGNHINIMGCEFANMGSGALSISGGNTEKLTAGENTVDNCLIYNTSSSDSSQPAVTISGVGNSFTNNEIVNIPGCAIFYSGNNNKIEYNYIHNCLISSDEAAAISSPDGWTNYGNKVRYNLLSNLGNAENTPVAVMPCSGTQVRGNMFINIRGIAVDLYGGRDIEVSNNLIVNCKVPVLYESLNLDSERYAQGGTAWTELEKSPYKTKLWQENFPQYTVFSTDFTQSASAEFAANPAGSLIQDNLILNADESIGTIDNKANTMSTVKTNTVLHLTQTQMFTDAKNGIYTINPNSEVAAEYDFFKDIPFDTIGRY